MYGTICTISDITFRLYDIQSLYSWPQTCFISHHTHYIWQHIHCICHHTQIIHHITPIDVWYHSHNMYDIIWTSYDITSTLYDITPLYDITSTVFFWFVCWCRREWQTTTAFLSWESHEQYEKQKYDTERWTPKVSRCSICYGEITPERMKRLHKCRNNAQFWMWVVMGVKSDVIKNSMA